MFATNLSWPNELLERARVRRIRAAFVTGDEVYGDVGGCCAGRCWNAYAETAP